jgi:hypothetical protein
MAVLLCHPQVYVQILRELYEAFVLYNFVALCLAAVGGPSRLVDAWREDEAMFPGRRRSLTAWCLWTCCLAGAPLTGVFLRRTVQGVLQFVVSLLL